MSVYLLRDRQAPPDRSERYAALVRRIADLGQRSGLLLFRLAAADGDPSRLLALARWDSDDAAGAFFATLPDELLVELAETIGAPLGPVDFYDPIREIENITIRPRSIVAGVLRATDARRRVIDDAKRTQERLIHQPGVASVRLLERRGDPGLFAIVNEYGATASETPIDLPAGARWAGPLFRGAIAAAWDSAGRLFGARPKVVAG
jgi:hypothetical protein